jgi:hypothetical protein
MTTEAAARVPLQAALAAAPPELYGYFVLAVQTALEQLEPESGGFSDASRSSMVATTAAITQYLALIEGHPHP